MYLIILNLTHAGGGGERGKGIRTIGICGASLRVHGGHYLLAMVTVSSSGYIKKIPKIPDRFFVFKEAVSRDLLDFLFFMNQTHLGPVKQAKIVLKGTGQSLLL